MMKILVPVTLLSVLHLTGCATVANTFGSPDETAQASDNSAADSVSQRSASQSSTQALIARDFVNAVKQLPSLPPARTAIELNESQRNDAFTLAMQSQLQSAGYATRWVNNESASALFEYRLVSEKAAALTQRATYELAIGTAELRRSYVTDDAGRIQPVTPLYVRGTDATGLVLNDEIFNATDSDSPAFQPDFSIASASATEVINVNAVPLKENAEPQEPVADTQSPVRNSSSLRLPPDANPLNSAVGKAVSSRSTPPAFATSARVENVFELGTSNFESMLSEHDIIKEQVLTFANDSMRLGVLNKQLVDQLVGQYNPQSDVFTVIGCSMGPTAVSGGNAALALGRAGRVVEALRFAGVSDKHIFDEGCWAGDGGFDDLPRRGVVLTLNRRA